MMRQRVTRFLMVGWAATLIATAGAASFTVGRVSGDVMAGKNGGAPLAVKEGEAYSSGTTVVTGKDGRMVGQFDARNSFTVPPETSVRLQDPAEGQTGVRLVLQGGRVESALEAWVPTHRYEVESAVGIFRVQGTAFAVSYRLGPLGEFIGGTEVSSGEVGYEAPECIIPSLTANGGVSVTRIVGLESVLLEITAIHHDLTVVIGGKHTIVMATGATVRLGVALRYLRVFAALQVLEGSVSVGQQVVAMGQRAVFISGTEVLPNEGAVAFLEAVRTESTAHAQTFLPGLTEEQLAALRETQRSGARAVLDSAVGAGVLPMYQPPFVPERPISAQLSPSGTP